jgi:hypothetical protein
MAQPLSGSLMLDASTLTGALAGRKDTRVIHFNLAAAGTVTWKADQDVHIVGAAGLGGSAFVFARDSSLTAAILGALNTYREDVIFSPQSSIGVFLQMFIPIKKDQIIYFNAGGFCRGALVIENDA